MTFVERVVAYMNEKGYRLFSSPGEMNIVYIEGVDGDGRVNADLLDGWNDRRLVFVYEGGAPVLVHNVAATSEPGRSATFSPGAAARGGVFRIMFGQHLSSWVSGYHKGNREHPALVHYSGSHIFGYRDLNKDGKRTGDQLSLGYGINQHGTAPLFNRETVGGYSEGCLVGRNWQEHLEFVRLYRSDPRFVSDRGFLFTATVIDGDDLQFLYPF